MIEVCEGQRGAAHDLAEIMEQRRRSIRWEDGCERPAGQPREQAREPREAGPSDVDDLGLREGSDDALARHPGRREPLQGPVLEVEERRVFCRVGDLQNEAILPVNADREVPVSLARQWTQDTPDAPMSREGLGGGRRIDGRAGQDGADELVHDDSVALGPARTE